VIEQAIAKRLAQTQTLFHGQATPGQPAPQVGHVRAQTQRRTTFDGGPALEVIGTYRLTGKGLSAAQQRLERDFDIYLQHRRDRDEWLLLHPTATAEDGTLRWRAIPINPVAIDTAEHSTAEGTQKTSGD
jgi:hypothetical protein